jgi:TonB-dependent receptor
MSSTDAQKLDKIKISVNFNNISLQEALQTIEQKSDLVFSYNSREIPLDEKVSLNFDQSSMSEVLTKLGQDVGLSFSQVDNFIVIKKINTPKSYPDNNARGGIKGYVKGSDTKSALPYAIVLLEGTNNGTTTDIDGNYVLRNINPGKHQISVSYVGYKTKKIDVLIKPDQISEINIVLEISSVEGEEVVITAQRTGQQGAINEQINSNVIKNVVSADRLQENPDANAAEAIGRLPGVSLIRSGGEGTGVVIRGLDPKYTQISMDGIILPTNNISGISQYDLQGVEVFKSITPDMEGNAVAGVINLTLKEAPSGLKYSLMAQGGYNDLNSYWKNYKFVADVSDRFFNEKLGVKFNIDAESVNRSDQTLSAGYSIKSVPPAGKLAPLFVNGINLNDETRINGKVAGTLILDYRLSSDTKLFFNNFFSHSNQSYTDVTKSYDVDDGSVNYSINNTPNVEQDLYVGSLKAVHQFKLFELDEGISLSQSNSYTPDSRNWLFEDLVPGLSKYGSQSVESLPLNQVLAGATDALSANTLNNFYLFSMGRSASDLIGRNLNAYINSKILFEFSNSISGYIKFGAQYKVTSNYQNYDSRSIPVGGLQKWGNYAITNFPWASEIPSGASLSAVGLNQGEVNNFLKGQYNFGWYPNIGRLNSIFEWWNNFSNYYLYVNPKATPQLFQNYIGFIPNWIGVAQNLQKVNEFYYAGYVMSEVNLGDMISFIPGVRYEKVRDNLGGWWIESYPFLNTQADLVSPGYSTDSTHTDEYWLPMAHLKIKPASWIQALLSFTQTLNRPAYSQLVPDVYLNRSAASGPFSYSSGNPDLMPEFWTNYDAQVVVSGDKIGLLSVTGFYKEVKNMIWTPSVYRTSGQAWPFGTDISRYFGDNSTVLITIPQNHNFPVFLKGLEFEAQTNLWYLPEPFNYISLNVNFTLISSETKYEYSKTAQDPSKTDSRGRPITYTVDSIYAGPMLNQPKSIANISFGYNYEGFNLWLSYQYTGSMVSSFPNLTEFETNVSQFAKWDLQVAQKLPIKGLELLFNFANINNPVGYQNYLADSRATYVESYGWTMDLGIRYSL